MTRAGHRRRQHPHSKRREERVAVAIPVKVSILSDAGEPPLKQFACTLDATKRGARLSGLSDSIRKGMHVEIERGGKKDLFLVVWVGATGSRREGQVGLSCVREEVTIFEADALEPKPISEDEDPAPSVSPPTAIATEVEIHPSGHRRKLAMAVALLLVATTWLAIRSSKATRAGSSSDKHSVAGMDPAVAGQVQSLQGWRMAQAADFSPAAIEYLSTHGQELRGQLPLDTAAGTEAYVLAPTVNSKGSGNTTRRAILAANHQPVYDINLPRLAFAAVVPRDELASADWRGTSQQRFQATTDGLLLVGNMSDAGSGLVLFLSGDRVIARTAVDFRSLHLTP